MPRQQRSSSVPRRVRPIGQFPMNVYQAVAGLLEVLSICRSFWPLAAIPINLLLYCHCNATANSANRPLVYGAKPTAHPLNCGPSRYQAGLAARRYLFIVSAMASLPFLRLWILA